MDQFRQDLASALRNVRNYPVACVVAILSLAGGLGAVTATLTVRNVLFRNPPPLYPDPGQLSRVQVGTPQQPVRPLGSAVPAALVGIWRDGQIGGAIGASTAARTRDVRAGDQTVQRPVRSVTPDFFSVIGVPPILGRVTWETDSGTAPAVLSYRVWQVLYEGRADIVGQPLWIDNQAYSVVAVMPDRFWFSSMDSPIWTSLGLSALHANEPLETIVRRDAGVSRIALAARLQPGLDEYARTLPASHRLHNLRVSGIEGTPVAMGMAVVLPYLIAVCVLLTLLIACANVAILMIAQWTGREQEIAIRSSLGASRGRIVRTLLTESVLIASCGGALGIAVTYALRGLIVQRAGPMVAFFDLTIPWSVLMQGILLTLMTGVIAADRGGCLWSPGVCNHAPFEGVCRPHRRRRQRGGSGPARRGQELEADRARCRPRCRPDAGFAAAGAVRRRRRELIRSAVARLRGSHADPRRDWNCSNLAPDAPGQAHRSGAAAAVFVNAISVICRPPLRPRLPLCHFHS